MRYFAILKRPWIQKVGYIACACVCAHPRVQAASEACVALLLEAMEEEDECGGNRMDKQVNDERNLKA